MAGWTRFGAHGFNGGTELYEVQDLKQFFADFPRLTQAPPHNWSPTSEATDRYNCIAFAFGLKDGLWWPNDPPGLWPIGASRDESVAAARAVFETEGYEEASGEDYETGVERVAIFARNGMLTHAARQSMDRRGWWRSKMGGNVDIDHELHAIGGGVYGEVALVMARARTQQRTRLVPDGLIRRA